MLDSDTTVGARYKPEPSYKELRERLIEATREGPVETWLSRMADVAGAAGIDAAEINWNNAPAYVAFEIIEWARSHDKIMALAFALPPLAAKGAQP